MERPKRTALKRKAEDSNIIEEVHDETEKIPKKKASKRANKRRALGTLTNNNAAAARDTSTADDDTIKPKPYISDGYQYTGEVDDVDERDEHNPLMVPEYVQEFFEHLKTKEKATFGFLELQPHITQHMRATLVNWVFTCQAKLRFIPETVYLCVNLIDRYLAKKKVTTKQKLKMVGAACLLIAAKYEEMYYYDIQDIVDMCDGECTREQVRNLVL